LLTDLSHDRRDHARGSRPVREVAPVALALRKSVLPPWVPGLADVPRAERAPHRDLWAAKAVPEALLGVAAVLELRGVVQPEVSHAELPVVDAPGLPRDVQVARA
jgi:hypothetical protein